jgi:branched-chain amino acid aminotransferase
VTVPYPAAWADGEVVPLSEARVPVTDRGFLLGDSIFETLVARGGHPFLLGDHLDRLRASAEAVGIPVPWSDRLFDDTVRAVLAGATERESVLRIVVTRGDAGPGLGFGPEDPPRLVVIGRARPQTAGIPVALRRDRGPSGRPGPVPPTVKGGSRQADVVRWAAGLASGADEVLVTGATGWAEGTTTNLFAVLDGTIRTPPVSEGLLPGTTRAVLLRALADAGTPAVEAPLSDVDLDGATEVFLTSTLRDVAPVRSLDGHDRGAPGPHTLRAAALFRRWQDALLARPTFRLAELPRP